MPEAETTVATETTTEETTTTEQASVAGATTELTAEETAAAETKVAEDKVAADKKLADDKAAADAAAEPLTFDALELPETFDKENALSGEFLELMNGDLSDKKGLADKLLDMQDKMAQESVQRWVDTNNEWRTAIESDKEYGGEKLAPGLAKVSAAMKDFAASTGSETIESELREALNITGAGNHPAVVKFLIWSSSQLGEGTPLSGGPASGEKTLAEKMYPNT